VSLASVSCQLTNRKYFYHCGVNGRQRTTGDRWRNCNLNNRWFIKTEHWTL